MGPTKKVLSDGDLDRILSRVRNDAADVSSKERFLFACAVSALVVTALRGAFAASPPLGLALAGGIVVGLGLLVWSARIGQRAERLRRDMTALELARDAFERDAVVEIHPYRARDEEETPRVVVKTSGPLDPGRPSPGRALPPSIARVLGFIVVFASLVLVAGMVDLRSGPAQQRWTFVEVQKTPVDLGLHPSPLRTGAWLLEDHGAATGARALVNHEGEPAAPPATIVANARWLRDFGAATRCKTDPAREVQQCGIVYHFRDESSYELVRLDTLRRELVLASVVRGEERTLARAPADVASGTWQELRIDSSAGVVHAFLNDRKLIEVVETVPNAGGNVGLWAPASGVAWFDELVIEGRADAPRALEVLPLLGKPRT